MLTAFTSIVADIIVALILVFSFIGGFREGAPREIAGLTAFILGLIFTYFFVGSVAGWLSFVSDDTWRSLFSFLLTLGIIIVILYLLLWIPRKFLEKVWTDGIIWSLMGGVLGLFSGMLGLALFIKLSNFYEVWPWLNQVLASSRILSLIDSMLGGVINTLVRTLPH
jgi:membrane protein required for colicin V production